jgi:hypothetical protein
VQGQRANYAGFVEGRETFSVASDGYASSRPQYPAELFAWVASQCKGRAAAWDCATGNGQAALGLAPHFERVEATDISPEQIGHAFPAANVFYSVQAAEMTKFPTASFDLVAVAQALHWFDFKRFWAEVRRTAKRNAFFCAWGYAWFECDPELEAALFTPIRQVLEPYWASENGIIWRGYRSADILFPFQRMEAPSFAIQLDWNIQTILRHIGTWSAYKRAMTDPKTAPLIADIEQSSAAQFRSSGPIHLRVPLLVVAGYVS